MTEFGVVVQMDCHPVRGLSITFGRDPFSITATDSGLSHRSGLLGIPHIGADFPPADVDERAVLQQSLLAQRRTSTPSPRDQSRVNKAVEACRRGRVRRQRTPVCRRPAVARAFLAENRCLKLPTPVDAPRSNSSYQIPEHCNCKRSMCRKAYCVCYRRGRACSWQCKCDGCKNCTDHPSDIVVLAELVDDEQVKYLRNNEEKPLQ